MYKKLENNNGFSAFNTSTLNVIRRRYSPQEVPWRGIHNAIAIAMSICVAFSNKVMDTPELPLPIKRHEAPKYDICSVGRSMIEMLGVLAIIAVLSVGEIAGYSKAMEMYKMNKLVQEYNSLIFNLIQYKQNFQVSMKQETILADFISNTVFLMPDHWKRGSYFYLKDSYDNLFYVRYEPAKSQIMSVIYLGAYLYNNDGTSMKWNKSKKLKDICKGIVANLVEPLHSVLVECSLVNYESAKLFTYKGNGVCGAGSECIKYLTPIKIENACTVCITDGNCNIVLRY